MAGEPVSDCLACRLAAGEQDLPGGRIHETPHWLVEHCVGPLGLGTLIVKPRRHCTHVWDLTDGEAAELGPLLRDVTDVVRAIREPDQVYVCLWSHGSWKPGHIHFVVQPIAGDLRGRFPTPGPKLQAEMFEAGVRPRSKEVERFAEKARELLAGR